MVSKKGGLHGYVLRKWKGGKRMQSESMKESEVW